MNLWFMYNILHSALVHCVVVLIEASTYSLPFIIFNSFISNDNQLSYTR